MRGLVDGAPIGECELCRTDVHWYVEGRSAVVVVVVVVVAGVDTGADANTGVTRALPVAEKDRKDWINAVVVGRDIMVYRIV